MVLLVLVASCDAISDFGDTNTNPTQVSTVPPELEFSMVQLGAAGSQREMERGNLIYASAVVQHLTRPFWVGNFYGRNDDHATSFWISAYSGQGVLWRAQIKNVENLLARLRQMKEEGRRVDNKIAAARIMRVLIFHRVTDMYGDTPYFEAARGFLEGEFTPAFDPQSEIYADMLKELDEAVRQFDPVQPTFADADFLYGGDILGWKKFANSLRLRLALRLVKVDPQRARDEAVAAINADGGVMTSNADLARVPHQSGPSTGPAGVNTNANSEAFSNPVFVTQTMVEWMRAHGDPRLRMYAAVITDEEVITDPDRQLGLPSGWTANVIDTHPSWPGNLVQGYSRINPMLADLDDPLIFQTYAEVEFMLAEAAVRGWIPDDAEAHYNAGVRAAMQYLTLYDAEGAVVTDEEVDTYLAANPFVTGGTVSEKLEQINTQYWAAVFLNGIEAWANWRRSGFPLLEPAPVDDPNPHPNNETNGEIPRRLLYPEEEAILNAANFQEVLDRQGPNTFMQRIWWDVEE